jgi:hypothetical protein
MALSPNHQVIRNSVEESERSMRHRCFHAALDFKVSSGSGESAGGVVHNTPILAQLVEPRRHKATLLCEA